MRIISLVPSWTETLIEAGADVVGCTRFCIHPASAKKIPRVGGTKNIDWQKVKELKPDLLLFDKEENPKEFADDCPFPWLATHVTSLESSFAEMASLSKALRLPLLDSLACEGKALLTKKIVPSDTPPAALSIIGEPKAGPFIYLIWKNPWMLANRQTFIGSICEHFGIELLDYQGAKYPEINIEEFKQANFLFSSEPFPFLKHKDELQKSGLNGWIVDGEVYSWFGIRSLRFLRSLA
jgi:hypothetical protein